MNNKGDMHRYGSYRGINLLSHTINMKKSSTSMTRGKYVYEQQYSLMPMKSTVDAILAFRLLKVRQNCIMFV